MAGPLWPSVSQFCKEMLTRVTRTAMGVPLEKDSQMPCGTLEQETKKGVIRSMVNRGDFLGLGLMVQLLLISEAHPSKQKHFMGSEMFLSWFLLSEKAPFREARLSPTSPCHAPGWLQMVVGQWPNPRAKPTIRWQQHFLQNKVFSWWSVWKVVLSLPHCSCGLS